MDLEVRMDIFEEGQHYEEVETIELEGKTFDSWHTQTELQMEDINHFILGKLTHKNFSMVISSLVEIGANSKRIKLDRNNVHNMYQMTTHL